LRRARINESASKDLYPPESSERDSFHELLNATFNIKPFSTPSCSEARLSFA